MSRPSSNFLARDIIQTILNVFFGTFYDTQIKFKVLITIFVLTILTIYILCPFSVLPEIFFLPPPPPLIGISPKYEKHSCETRHPVKAEISSQISQVLSPGIRNRMSSSPSQNTPPLPWWGK